MSATRRYLDLILELRDLDAEADTFKINVLPSPEVGETQQATCVAYNFGELEDDLDSLENRAIDQEDLIKLGQGLANRLLPDGQVRDLFKQAFTKAGADGSVRLRLLIRNPELAQIPWEFSYLQIHEGERDRRHFLALNPKISIVRHEALPEEHTSLAGAKPNKLRLVVAMASPVGYRELNLKREKKVIEKILKDFNVDGVTIEWEPLKEETTFDDLTTALQNGADLFHFAGHGTFSEEDVDRKTGKVVGAGSITLLEDRVDKKPHKLAAGDLALYLQKAGVRVALLGACESGRRDGVSAWTGIAPALVERGIPAVVAMQYKVEDDFAIEFSRMFYTSLAGGLSLDEAVSAGRLAMLGKSDEDDAQWGVPVLYMRSPNGIIFPRLLEQAEEGSTIADKIRMEVQQTIDTIETGGKVVGIKSKIVSGSYGIRQNARIVKGELHGWEGN